MTPRWFTPNELSLVGTYVVAHVDSKHHRGLVIVEKDPSYYVHTIEYLKEWDKGYRFYGPIPEHEWKTP